jgi:uncharacterized protein YukE
VRTEYRGLGFDPTPGSVDAVVATADQLRGAATALAGVDPALRRAESAVHGWRGSAADAFRAAVRDTPSDFAERERALRDGAAALDRWAQTLAANQRRAEELDRAAVRLRGRLDAARDLVQDKQNALDVAATPVAAASASTEVTAATSAVAELERELAEVVERARNLEREHLRAANAVADELAAPPGAAPVPRSDEPVLRALSGVLGRASQTSRSLAALLAPGAPAAPPRGAAAAFAGALSGRPETTGELVVSGETPLGTGGES